MGEFGIMERHEIDKLVREAGNAFYDAGLSVAPAMVKVISQEASKRGVDPRYVLYIFLTQPNSRNLAAGRYKDEMETLYRSFIESSYKMPSREFSIPPPELEGAVDETLGAVAQWAGNEFAEALAQEFIKVAKRVGSEIQRVYADEYGEKISSSKARKFLVYQLGLRLRSHPHWFRDHSLLYKMMNILFDMP